MWPYLVSEAVLLIGHQAFTCAFHLLVVFRNTVLVTTLGGTRGWGISMIVSPIKITSGLTCMASKDDIQI